MSEQVDLRNIQRRTIQLTNYEDGMWDILLGLILLMLSIYPVTREILGPILNLVFFLVILLLLVVGQIATRRFLSTPRLGYAKSRRTPALKIALVLTLALVLITFGLVISTLVNPGWISTVQWEAAPNWLNELKVDIVVMLVVVGLFSFLGYSFGITRLYLYGWLIGGGFLASTALYIYAGMVFNLPLAIVSGIIISIGVVLFIRFFQRYPIPNEGELR